MSRTNSRGRGARRLRLPDWPYGAVGRRRVLEALLLGEQPEDGWTKAALEDCGGTTAKGIEGVLAGALAWGLVVQDQSGTWRRAEPLPPIASPLEDLLRLTREAEDRPIAALQKRSYTPRRPRAKG